MTSPSSRGQTETLGVVLLLGITLAGTTLVVAFGSSMLDDSKRATELDAAEHAMAQLDSKASLVAIGESDAQRVDLGVGNDGSVGRTDGGWMRVRVDPDDGSGYDVMNESLGAVEYRNGDTTIAYEGGGVWKRTDDGSVMVSPPEFHYRDTTLTLPLVVVEGEEELSGELELTPNGATRSKFPLADPGDPDGPEKVNPLSEASVNVTVKSDYYRAWGAFFEQRTGGGVEYDHDAGTVTLTLVTPTKAPKISQGLAATSPQELVIKGSGGNPSFTDSYNSSVGSYVDTEGSNGTIKTVGGVSMNGGAEIRGDLVSGGGVVEMGSSKTRIAGNLSYGGSDPDLHKHATVDGWVANNGSVERIDPVNRMIDRERESLAAENDNEGTDGIENRRLADGGTVTLTAGDYYLDSLSLSGSDELVFDLSGGDVDLFVDDDVTLNGGRIGVVDPENGTANVYMNGNSLSVTNGATVSIPGDRSRALRLYGRSGTDAEFSDSTFVGVFYAPDSESQRGRTSVTSHADVYGALVGGQTLLQSGGAIHYDRALVVTETLPVDYTAIPRVTYMHVSVNRVNVTAA